MSVETSSKSEEEYSFDDESDNSYSCCFDDGDDDKSLVKHGSNNIISDENGILSAKKDHIEKIENTNNNENGCLTLSLNFPRDNSHTSDIDETKLALCNVMQHQRSEFKEDGSTTMPRRCEVGPDCNNESDSMDQDISKINPYSSSNSHTSDADETDLTPCAVIQHQRLVFKEKNVPRPCEVGPDCTNESDGIDKDISKMDTISISNSHTSDEDEIKLALCDVNQHQKSEFKEDGSKNMSRRCEIGPDCTNESDGIDKDISKMDTNTSSNFLEGLSINNRGCGGTSNNEICNFAISKENEFTSDSNPSTQQHLKSVEDKNEVIEANRRPKDGGRSEEMNDSCLKEAEDEVDWFQSVVESDHIPLSNIVRLYGNEKVHNLGEKKSSSGRDNAHAILKGKLSQARNLPTDDSTFFAKVLFMRPSNKTNVLLRHRKQLHETKGIESKCPKWDSTFFSKLPSKEKKETRINLRGELLFCIFNISSETKQRHFIAQTTVKIKRLCMRKLCEWLPLFKRDGTPLVGGDLFLELEIILPFDATVNLEPLVIQKVPRKSLATKKASITPNPDICQTVSRRNISCLRRRREEAQQQIEEENERIQRRLDKIADNNSGIPPQQSKQFKIKRIQESKTSEKKELETLMEQFKFISSHLEAIEDRVGYARQCTKIVEKERLEELRRKIGADMEKYTFDETYATPGSLEKLLLQCKELSSLRLGLNKSIQNALFKTLSLRTDAMAAREKMIIHNIPHEDLCNDYRIYCDNKINPRSESFGICPLLSSVIEDTRKMEVELKSLDEKAEKQRDKIRLLQSDISAAKEEVKILTLD